jgi:hypothetical protein
MHNNLQEISRVFACHAWRITTHRFKQVACFSGVSSADVLANPRVTEQGTQPVPLHDARAILERERDDWRVVLSGHTAGAVLVIVTFEAINQPCITAEGGILGSSEHSIVIVSNCHGFDSSKALLLESLPQCNTDWLPLLYSQADDSTEARLRNAVNMMLAASAATNTDMSAVDDDHDADNSSVDGTSDADSDEPDVTTARSDNLLMQAVFGANTTVAEYERLVAACADDLVIPESVYSAAPRGHLLLAFTQQLVRAKDFKEAFVACKQFLSLHAVTLTATSTIAAPLHQCWDQFEAAVSSEVLPLTVTNLLKHVLGERCSVTETLSVIAQVLDNLAGDTTDTLTAWSTLLLTAHQSGALSSSSHRALQQLCATASSPTDAPQWRRLLIFTVLSGRNSPGVNHLLELVNSGANTTANTLVRALAALVSLETPAPSWLRCLLYALMLSSKASGPNMDCSKLVSCLLNAAQLHTVSDAIMCGGKVSSDKIAASNVHTLLAFIAGPNDAIMAHKFVELLEKSPADVYTVLRRRLAGASTEADTVLLAEIELPSETLLAALIHYSTNGEMSQVVEAITEIMTELVAADLQAVIWDAVIQRGDAVSQLIIALAQGRIEECLDDVTNVIYQSIGSATNVASVACSIWQFLDQGGISMILDNTDDDIIPTVLQSLSLCEQCTSSLYTSTSLTAFITLMSAYPEQPSVDSLITFMQLDTVSKLIEKPQKDVTDTCSWFARCIHGTASAAQRLADAASTPGLFKHVFKPLSDIKLLVSSNEHTPSPAERGSASVKYVEAVCTELGIACTDSSTSVLGRTVHCSRPLLLAFTCITACQADVAAKEQCLKGCSALFGVVGLLHLLRSNMLVGSMTNEKPAPPQLDPVGAGRPAHRRARCNFEGSDDGAFEVATLTVGTSRAPKHTLVSTAPTPFSQSVTLRAEVSFIILLVFLVMQCTCARCCCDTLRFSQTLQTSCMIYIYNLYSTAPHVLVYIYYR